MVAENDPRRTEAIRIIVFRILDQPGMKETMEKLAKE